MDYSKLKELVDRFLAWPLPDDVCADSCATMPGYPYRSGTNLLTATQAEQMLSHVVGPLLAEVQRLTAEAAQMREALARVAEIAVVVDKSENVDKDWLLEVLRAPIFTEALASDAGAKWAERMRKLEAVTDWLEYSLPEMECRGDEDCDHCVGMQMLDALGAP